MLESTCSQMRSVSVSEYSVWAQEGVPAGDDHDLNSDDQPEPFQEAFFAGFVVKQPHAKERSNGTAGKRQCQQDSLVRGLLRSLQPVYHSHR